MRALFYLYDPPWPIRGGQQLHTYNMIKALVSLGHTVHLATHGDIGLFPSNEHNGWSVSKLSMDENALSSCHVNIQSNIFVMRWLRYWGIPLSEVVLMRQLIKDFKADSVTVVGLQALPIAAALNDSPTVWYAADDWILHHYTLMRKGSFSNRIHSLRNTIVSLLYERSLSSLISGAIAVSKRDQKALKNLGGFRTVALIPNGVDGELFKPRPDKGAGRRTICFWGRMDFAPNSDAMIWFCKQVWPSLLNRFPDAFLTIVGANPTPEVLELERCRNVKVTGEVEDIRPYAWASEVVIMPIRAGGGIKNKLLEACAMGKAVVASEAAVAGLEAKEGEGANLETPWVVAHNKEDWVNSISELWNNPDRQVSLGCLAREYSQEHHSWTKAATEFTEFIEGLKNN